MLNPDEIRRRIVAARTVRGMEQTELAQLMVEDGLGKHDLGRIERGDLEFRASHRRSIAHHLRVSERWFLEEDIDAMLLNPQAGPTLEHLADVLADHDRFARDTATSAIESRTRSYTELQMAVQQNATRLENIERLLMEVAGNTATLSKELALRDATRAASGSLAALQDSASQGEQVAGDTRDAEDATPGSTPARASRKR